VIRLPGALVVILLAAGCGADAEEDRAGAAATGETHLTIVVQPDGPEGEARQDVLRCPGDARCAKLDPEAFAPTPADVACTEIWGGPATAKVTGRLNGRPLEATFSRNNGCEIARWDALQWLLGPGGPPSGP
jgi:hypothetical protein